MAKISVINPHPRLLNLAHSGAFVSIVPGVATPVDDDDVVRRLIDAGDLVLAAAESGEGKGKGKK